ncbi:MAG: bifunctional glutamate N-acetyltransferase/amino-acid acetyltransferase ArgJ [Chloroflexota bacterium]|nr:bifunctional glutamate N-acetyltransferase/amino-acid acetyltransferase ArgJ [Chloroflexota bacterium]
MSIRSIPGGITSAKGFAVAIGQAGIRDSGGPDLVLIVSDRPAAAAATFTTNRLRAAPILLAEESLAASRASMRAIVVNAGCANAGTGAGGLEDARAVVAAVARRIGVTESEVLPASTGLIGSRLPVAAVVDTVARLRVHRSPAAARRAARAIMTTDTQPKEHAVAVRLRDGREMIVGGMAKGAGMIHPQMATMLAFLTTDAPIEPGALQALVKQAVERTFNQVSVDGDTSTNDAVMVLANGAAGDPQLAHEDLGSMADALEVVCRSLAIAIAADGEGARHLIEVTVHGAADDADARRVARTVASSALVKTAVHGADPNWGRIAAAAGRSGVALDAERMRICIGDVPVYDGAPLAFDQRRASRIMAGSTVPLVVDLLGGSGRGVAWGCDLSADYVAINSEYTT